MDWEALVQSLWEIFHSQGCDAFEAHLRRCVMGQPIDGLVQALDEHFPRLTPLNTPPGVLRARYEIDLGLVQSQKISLDQALQELGVF